MNQITANRLADVLRATPEVVAAWLFGSAESGRMINGSDIDIAVLFDRKPTLDLQLDIMARLQDAATFEKIDLVPLNDASPILQFEAVNGTLLLSRDESRRAEFVSLVAREYEDETALAERHLRGVKLSKSCDPAAVK